MARTRGTGLQRDAVGLMSVLFMRAGPGLRGRLPRRLGLGEEARDPKRTVPRGLGFIVVVIALVNSGTGRSTRWCCRARSRPS